MEDSLKKRYSIKLFSNIIGGVIGMIIVAIVPAALGPTMYGQFSYLQQFLSKIIAFLDAGSSTAFFTKLSAKPNRKELVTFYSFYAIFILFFILIFFYLVDVFDYLNIFFPDINSEYVFLAILFTFFTWATQVIIKISDAYALTVSVEWIKVIHKLFSLFLLLYFVHYVSLNLEYYFYFHFISIGSFIGIILYLFIKKDIISKEIITYTIAWKKLTTEFISYCSPLVVYSIASLGVGLFDVWLLQKMGGSIETGFYGLAYSIAAMCFLFTSAMTPIITREFSKAFEEENIEKMRTLYKRYIPMLYSIAAYFGVFISIQSENLLAIFTDENFIDAYLVLVIMATYPIHQTYGQLSGSVFYATGDTKTYRNIGLLSMLIGIILSFLLVYLYDFGAVGLAWKMVIGQIIAVNIQLFYNAKLLDLDIKYFLLHQIVSLIFFSLMAFIATELVSLSSVLTEFLFSGIIYTVLVIIFILIFPQIFALSRVEIRENVRRLKRVIKK